MRRHLYRLNGAFNYFARTVFTHREYLISVQSANTGQHKRGLAHLLTFQASLGGLIMLHYFSRKRKGLCSGDPRAHGSLPTGTSPSVTLSFGT